MQSNADKECKDNIQEPNNKRDMIFHNAEKISAVNFKKLMESSKSSDRIEWFTYKLDGFVLFQNSVCVLETTGKQIAFHLEDVFVNGKKPQNAVEELKNARKS